MSRLFPHTPHAEDQPYAHTLLTAHVLYRGFQSGAVLGLTWSTLRAGFTRKLPAPQTLPRTTAFGSLAFTALMVSALYMRMRSKQAIEWKDRSWRLLENRGQMEVDDFSLVGTVGGGVAGAVRGARGLVLVGAAGVGSLVGVGAYMGWRYGIKGGVWEEDERR